LGKDQKLETISLFGAGLAPLSPDFPRPEKKHIPCSSVYRKRQIDIPSQDPTKYLKAIIGEMA